VRLVVELDDLAGDVGGRIGPEDRGLLVADIEHHGIAILGGVLDDDVHHLLPQVLHELAFLLLDVGVEVLAVALQALLIAVDVAGDFGFRLLAHRGATLFHLVLKGLDVGVLLGELVAAGGELGLQVAGCLLAIFGLQDRLLHADDGDFGRRCRLSMRERGQAQSESGKHGKILLQAENS